MQDSTQSFGLNQQMSKKPSNRRSILVLSLFGTCMFLFILCGCLVTVLVLIGRSLSTNALLHTTGERLNTSKPTHTTNTDNTYLLSIRDFASKIISSSTIPTTNVFETSSNSHLNNSGIESTSSSELNIISGDTSTISTMRTAQLPKIIEQLGWRLPTEIRPTLYNLLLRPDFDTKSFSGQVAIHLDVVKPISFVAVHSKFLSITKTTLVQNEVNGGERDIEISNAFNYPEKEYWVTELPKPLSIGEYVLNLTFNGSLTDRIVGFYQSSYNDTNKNVTR